MHQSLPTTSTMSSRPPNTQTTTLPCSCAVSREHCLSPAMLIILFFGKLHSIASTIFELESEVWLRATLCRVPRPNDDTGANSDYE